MHGWIKLHRKILESPVFNEPGILKLWVYCLTKASHKKTKFLIGQTLVDLEPGQFVTGRNSLADDYNKGMKPKNKVSEVTLWRWLLLLESMGNLNIKKTNKFSVVTIDKWGFYQGVEDESEQQNEQQMNNKRTSNEQQMYTNKNIKKDKNVKKENISSHKFQTCDMENAELLFELMVENNPKVKQPNFEKWANDFRLIRERDGKTVEQIQYLINWTQKDEFWKTNVLSPSKLRQKWDQLVLKVMSEKKKGSVAPKSKGINFDALREEVENEQKRID